MKAHRIVAIASLSLPLLALSLVLGGFPMDELQLDLNATDIESELLARNDA